MLWLIAQDDKSTRLITGFRVRDNHLLLSTNNNPDFILVFKSKETADEYFNVLNRYITTNTSGYIEVNGEVQANYCTEGMAILKKSKVIEPK